MLKIQIDGNKLGEFTNHLRHDLPLAGLDRGATASDYIHLAAACLALGC